MFAAVAVRFLTFYQKFLRGFFPQSCRFQPTCSEFAKEAVLRYGFVRGLGKAMGRLGRCHPWSGKSGYDPLN